MKLLPIRINGITDYMVDFENFNFEYPDTFIVRADVGGTLVDFFKQKGHQANNAVIFQDTTEDKVVYLNDITQSQDGDIKTISVRLSHTNGGQAPEHAQDAKQLLKHLSFNRMQDIETWLVNFEYTDENKMSYNASIKIFLAPAKRINDVVIDCGSESTQMAMFTRGGDYSINNRVQIFPQLVEELREDLLNDNREINYDEQDTGNNIVQAEVKNNQINNYLYKSVYFVKKEVTDKDVEDTNILPDSKQELNENSVLRMCTSLNEVEGLKEKYIQMYNMKIAAFGGISLPTAKIGKRFEVAGNIGDNFFYRKYLSQFLNQILAIASDYKQKKVICLYVLVPNVYTPKRVHDFISQIRIDAENIINSNDEYKKWVCGIAVKAVSESDASLIGAYEQRGRNRYDNGDYLILDAGKGTLDFSITRLNNGEFTNLMKAGFVGASAAINYGFLLDLLAAFKKTGNEDVEVDSLRNFIFSNVLGLDNPGKVNMGGDLKALNDLMQAIDEYKIRYAGLAENVAETEQRDVDEHEQVKLTTFVEWIRKCQVKVNTAYVDAIIDTIVEYVKNKINDYSQSKEVKFVMFSGRGFLYQPLKDRMHNMLKEAFPEIEEVTFIRPHVALDNKNVCLFSAKGVSEGRYNNDALAIPYQVNKDDINSLIERSNSTEPTDNADNVSEIDTNRPKTGRWVVILTEGMGDAVESEGPKQKVPDGGRQAKVPKCDNIVTHQVDNAFVCGHDIVAAPNASIIIGGNIYDFAKDVALGKASLFYSQGRILLRDNNGLVSELEVQSNLDKGLSFPSLFPFCTLGNGSNDDIYIPQIDNREIDAEQAEANDNATTSADSNVSVPEKDDIPATADAGATIPAKDNTQASDNQNDDLLSYLKDVQGK